MNGVFRLLRTIWETKMKRINKILLLIICVLWCSSHSAQVQLKNYVFGNGAVIISNGTHTISSTVGQSIIGGMNNSLHSSNIGFWQQYSQTITDVDDMWMLEIPNQFELFQNYPNPFNPTTTVRYTLPKESKVKIVVYNMLGEVVTVLVDDLQEAGNYEVNFEASRMASGVYIYRIQAGDFVETKKMVLMK